MTQTRAQRRAAIIADFKSPDVPRIRIKWGRIAILVTTLATIAQFVWIIAMVLDNLPTR